MCHNAWVTVGMDLSCLLFTMRSRRAVPFLIPTIALYPRQLLFYDPRPPRTHLKSTLLQVFILENLKPFGINTYEKQGRGYRLWLTKYSKVVSSSILRTHFQVPYPATSLFATLTKTAGVWGDSSALHPAPENRKSARTRGACGNTQNTRRGFRGPGNTICIRSLRRCLFPSTRGPDT